MIRRSAARLRGRYRRTISQNLARRSAHLSPRGPIISFTFDDFPKSAARTAAAIMEEAGCRGTFYASFGLMGRWDQAGEMFDEADIHRLVEAGHEVGCHTFDHLDAWTTPAAAFDASIGRNLEAVRSVAPQALFRSSSYPISWPSPANKKIAGGRFTSCRCGGQGFNTDTVDLNSLNAYFLEQGGNNLAEVRELIQGNKLARGWLIFATHDVCEHPTRLGCTADFFRSVVRAAKGSGAVLATVEQACRAFGLMRTEQA